MEGVIVTAALLSVGQLAMRCFRLAQGLSSVRDDKFDQLYWRMELEKAKTVEWTRALLAAKYAPPPSQRERFDNLLQGLITRFRELEAVLSKLYPQGLDKRGMSIRMVVLSRRLLFELGRFDDISDKLKTIKAMNENLAILVPAPRAALRITGSSTVTKSVETPAAVTPKNPVPALGISTQDHALRSGFLDAGSPVALKPALVTPLPFRSIYQTGTRTLETLLKASPNGIPMERIRGVLSRLNLWASSVFEDKNAHFDAELDLDNLWTTPAGQRHKDLGIFVLKTLISILIAELFILDRLLLDLPDQSTVKSDLQQAKSPILLALANEDVTDLVRQRFEEIYPSWSDIEPEPESDGETQAEDDVGDAASTMGWEDRVADDGTPAISSSLDDIEVSLHCLYTVLSSISRCRQSHLLDLEAQHSPSAQAAAEAAAPSDVAVVGTPQRTSSTLSNATYFPSRTDTPDTTPATSINLDAHRNLIRSNLELAKELMAIFQADEDFYKRSPKKARPKIRTFSPILKNEIRRLEDYYSALSSPDCHPVPQPDEVQAALAQNNAGLRMIEYMYEPSIVSPKKGASANADAIILSHDEKLETMIKNFAPASFSGLAQGSRAMVPAADG